LAKLRQEIAQKGVCVPIIVRKGDNGYCIVDGEHRWRICRDLGFKEIPCIIQDFSDTEAKIKTLQLNYMRGSAVPVKLASLIHDLNREITLSELSKRLPYEEPQLMDNLELLKLPEDFGRAIEEQARKEEQELPSVISFVVYKEQAEVIEEAIRIVLETLKQAGWIIEYWYIDKYYPRDPYLYRIRIISRVNDIEEQLGIPVHRDDFEMISPGGFAARELIDNVWKYADYGKR